MRIGVNIPNDAPAAALYGLAEMGMAAEEAGAESLWVSDHLLMVDSGAADYPFSNDGTPTWPLDDDYYEALISLAVISARTRTARLGTAILVLPQRNLLEVAKMAASLDQLSGGRLVLGVGAGWSKGEFEALGYSYSDRGARLDEMIDGLRACWTGRPSAFDGDAVRIPANVILHPRPVRPTGPPILVGGTSRSALRRAGGRGDGWLGIAFAAEWDEDVLADSLDVVTAAHAESSRQGRPYNVLKLHANDEAWDLIPSLVMRAAEIGFDEVAVDLPWHKGVHAACGMLSSILLSARGARSAS